ncbi:Hypothetical predicted protein [Pelobates cultripes]|uniref:Uncharacterized protein n=1 Tax=Pelobates cultripes TaxID=61616 RepID=A0AAD1T140_PELCU|nr:Hypothetical predicted protein [Pelobates cultripes]
MISYTPSYLYSLRPQKAVTALNSSLVVTLKSLGIFKWTDRGCHGGKSKLKVQSSDTITAAPPPCLPASPIEGIQPRSHKNHTIKSKKRLCVIPVRRHTVSKIQSKSSESHDCPIRSILCVKTLQA